MQIKFQVFTATLLGAVLLSSTAKSQSFAPENSSNKNLKTMSVTATSASSFFIDNQNSLWACGNNSYGQLADGSTTKKYLPGKSLANVQQVAGGDKHSLILKTEN